MNLIKKLLTIVGLGVVVASCGAPSVPTENVKKVASAITNTNTHNGVFLARAYVSGSSFQNYQFGAGDILTLLRSKGIDTIYVNTADAKTCTAGCDYADGTFTYSSTSLVTSFLTKVKAWEDSHPTEAKWTLWAGINGTHGETYASGTAAASSTTSMVVDGTKVWVPNKWVGKRAKIMIGTTPEWRTIVSNDASSFTVSPAFSVAPGGSAYSINHAWPVLASDRAAVRQKVADESLKLTVPSTSGYIGDPNRAFDGVMLDFEPAGYNVPTCPEAVGDPRRFDCTKLMLQKVRSVLNPTNSSTAPKVGFTPPRFRDTNSSPDTGRWTYSMFYYGGLYADELMVMAYNTSIQNPTEAEVTSYIRTSTAQISSAITGEQWGWDASHPMPSRLVNVRIGIGAYENDGNSPPMHNRSMENVRSMTSGLALGLTDMSTPPAQGYSGLSAIKGAAIFTYYTGTYQDTGGTCHGGAPYCDALGVEKFGYMNDTWDNWNTYWTSAIAGW